MLDQNPGATSDPAPPENRAGTEVDLPFPILLREKAPREERFEIATVVDRLSGQHVSLRLSRPLPVGARLFVYVRLLPADMPDRPTAGVASYGKVQSNDPQPDNRWCVTITFERHRFLYAASAAMDA